MTDTKLDIKALAKLARLEVSDEELARLEKEIPNILAFVETIQTASAVGRTESVYGETKCAQGSGVPKNAKVADIHETPELRNVMRADENPHESGIHTEELLKAAPAREGNRIVVKQVISRKKRM